MTRKKSNGGDGKEPASPSRSKKMEPTKMRRPASARNTHKRTSGVQKRTSVTAERRLPKAEELRDDIAKRAYELYERRGWNHGQDLSDWLEAEQQILGQQSFAGS